jgi:signal peptidase II
LKSRYLYFIALAVIALDQITKYLAETRLPSGLSVRVAGKLLYLTTLHNSGGAFGIMQSWTGVLTVVSLVAVAVIVVYSRKKGVLPVLVSLGLSLQLGGALGNAIDRLRFGYVVDFIDLGWWPVFNVADTAITVGIVCLAYHLLFREARRPAEILTPEEVSKD